MSSHPLSLAAVVTNTSPAQVLGPEPITGKSVTLERLTPKHFSDLYEHIGSDPDLWVWWLDEIPGSTSAFHEYMSEFMKLMPDDLAIYAVIPLSGANKGRALGLAMALSQDRETNRVGELGLFYGHALKKTRAGTEVISLLGSLLFDKLNHRRVGWKTNSLNAASRRAAERYGFVLEGIIRNEQINKGRNRDTALYSIIESEWPVIRMAFEKWLEDESFDEEGRQKSRLEDIRESLK